MDRIINQLHREHPVQMAKLYVKYGIPKARLNVQTTKDLMTVYGDDFMYDIHKATGFEGTSFLGKLFKKKDKEGVSAAGESSASGEEKGKFMDKLRNFGKKAFGAYSAIQSQGGNLPAEAQQYPKPKDEKILGMSKPLFYAVVAVGLILIVYVLTNKNKQAA